MEPEDLLRGGDEEPKAGADELRAIVSRAQRRRWRAAVGGLAVALVIGGGAGYALSNHHSPAQSVSTSPAAGSKGGSGPPSAGPAAAAGEPASSSVSGQALYSSLFPERLQPLFTRMAGSVDIRGFLVSSTIKLPEGYAMPACGVLGPRFQAEVSTAKMVGTATAGFATADPSKALSDVGTTIVGVAEGDPTLVVSASTSKGVAEVKVTGFTGGVTDSMAPVQGWVALAGPTGVASSSATSPANVGTITALSSSGQVLASQTLTSPMVPTPGLAPLSSAAGAQAANGASVVCMGSRSGTSGSGTGGSGTGTGSGSAGTGASGTGTGTGTLHVSCPPVTVSPIALPGAATSSAGSAPSNPGANGAPATCRVTVKPAATSATNSAAG